MVRFRSLLNVHIEMAFAILLDSLLVILMLGCFFTIDHVIHFCEFENELFTTILHSIVHPVVLLMFFVIFVMNMIKDHLPNDS